MGQSESRVYFHDADSMTEHLITRHGTVPPPFTAGFLLGDYERFLERFHNAEHEPNKAWLILVRHDHEDSTATAQAA